jgi:hypothetical protein
LTTTRRLLRRVEDILLCEWNPIVIADEPQAQNEYDSRAPRIASLPLADAPESAMVEALLRAFDAARSLKRSIG